MTEFYRRGASPLEPAALLAEVERLTSERDVEKAMRVERGPVNVQTFFVHRGPAPRSFYKHDRFLAGKVVS